MRRALMQVLGLGTDTGDTTPSVLLFFDQERCATALPRGLRRCRTCPKAGAALHRACGRGAAHARRYLFNAGEGFQRYANEYGVKLNKLSGVLLTRVSTDASGGLPGAAPGRSNSSLVMVLGRQGLCASPAS